jgi:hypothetical protein
MSRGQSTQAFNTASSQNATNFGNAQSAEGTAQNDIDDYQNQLASFVSGNPYTAGGEYDQTINAGLANTSNAASNSLQGSLQSQALRTGQNSAADAATAATAAETNEQNLSAQQAAAQQQRISDEAGYNQEALSASAEPAQMESSLYGTAGSQGNQELGTEEGAAQTPSFWDTLGGTFAGGLGSGLGRNIAGGGK